MILILDLGIFFKLFSQLNHIVRTPKRGAFYFFTTKKAFLRDGGNSSALAAANCDPDYGWIDGPEGTNKCYMYLKVV